MSDTIDTAQEEWRPVKGYEGFYSVSNLGNVRRDKAHPKKRWKAGRILKQQLHYKGYLKAWLCNDTSQKRLFVHRLVADAFLEPMEGKNQTNHKDGNKTNNCVSNLERCTHSENLIHSYRVLGKNPLKGRKIPRKVTPETSVQIRQLFSEGKFATDIGKLYGICASSVLNIVHRRSWENT